MSYLESEDDGPDETERESRVSIDYVMRPHVLQVHTLLIQEHQRLVNVLQTMDTHFALRWSRLERDGKFAYKFVYIYIFLKSYQY